MPAPSYLIRPATLSDLPQLCQIYHTSNRTGLLYQLCYKGVSEQSLVDFHTWLGDWIDAGDKVVVVARDSKDGTVLGLALWIHVSSRTVRDGILVLHDQSMKALLEDEPDGANLVSVEEWQGQEDVVLREVAKRCRCFWYLEDICVLPEYEGIGIGSSLLGWGLKKATDAACITGSNGSCPVFLSSTQEAKSYWERKLFVPDGDPYRSTIDSAVITYPMVYHPLELEREEAGVLVGVSNESEP